MYGNWTENWYGNNFITRFWSGNWTENWNYATINCLKWIGIRRCTTCGMYFFCRWNSDYEICCNQCYLPRISDSEINDDNDDLMLLGWEFEDY